MFVRMFTTKCNCRTAKNDANNLLRHVVNPSFCKVPHKSNSGHLFWNFKDPRLASSNTVFYCKWKTT